MSGNLYRRLVLSVLSILGAGVLAVAQEAFGSYAPYTVFGVGDLYGSGNAVTSTMGGIGVATRDNHFINPVNPASVTARDSLAFMADVSFYQGNKYFRQGDKRAANNTANLGNLILSFPIYHHSAFMVGVMPFSSTGFGYISEYDDPDLASEMGSITYTASGQGSLYQAFLSAGVTLWKRLSLGAEGIYYFGNTQKSYYETISEASFLGAKNGYDMNLKGVTGKFGLQYDQKIGGSRLVVGATYRLATNLKGTVEGYRYSTGSAATDTLYHETTDLGGLATPVRLGSEIGVGVSFMHADKWRTEVNYSRSDWTGTGLGTAGGFAGNLIPGTGNSIFTTSVSQSVNAGFEIVPNRSDIRYYFNRCAYRAGAYYKTEYYKLDGHEIPSYGITFGMTLPVFRWYNGLTIGVDLGRRGSHQNNLISENYIKFNIAVNIFDIWFQKIQYN